MKTCREVYSMTRRVRRFLHESASVGEPGTLASVLCMSALFAQGEGCGMYAHAYSDPVDPDVKWFVGPDLPEDDGVLSWYQVKPNGQVFLWTT